MSRTEEFDAFYAHTRSRLLHQTYALTADLGAAAAAVRDAFARSWEHWRTVRTGDPEAWVRREARRLAAGRHSTHRLGHRLDDSGTDIVLLDALQRLPADQRALLVLQTVADVDLSAAAREVGLSDAAAAQASDTALTTVAARLDDARPTADDAHRARPDVLDDLEPRLAALRSVSGRVAMPRAAVIRQQGQRRRRRGTAAAVAVAVAALVVSGFVVTLPPDSVPVAADRREIGETAPPPRPEPPGADPGQLLGTPQLAALDPRGRHPWRAARLRGELYSVCQQRRTADPRAREVIVRASRAVRGPRQHAVQAVEVSRTPAAAVGGYQAVVGWYAGCQAARVQLVSRHVVSRPGGAVQILSLREWQDPVRTLTVAVARTGVVVTTLVHEVDRASGPVPRAMARSTAAALDLLCPTSDGACGTAGRPEAAPLPPTGEGPGFLGAVDLPPVADLDTVWAGTEPTRTPAVNPAATICDQADFTEPGFVSARSRVFVMPEANLPQRFGLSQTVGLTSGRRQAERFVADAVARVSTCADRELSAQVDSHDLVRARSASGDVVGHVWRLTFEVAEDTDVSYWLGLVRVAGRVAELSFSGTPEADLGERQFGDLVLRAGERLRELDGTRR